MFINPTVNNFIFGEVQPFLKNHILFKDGEVRENDEASKLNLPLEKCVAGYSSRQGVKKIGYLLYRIWNAVKAIFNQSDWQKLSRESNNFFLRLRNNPNVEITPMQQQVKDSMRNLQVIIFKLFISANGKNLEEAQLLLKEKLPTLTGSFTEFLKIYYRSFEKYVK